MAALTKCCNRCGVEKSHAEFYRQPDVVDGLTASCQTCKKAYQRAYREANLERTRAAVRDCNMRNAENRRVYQQEWRDANREWVRDHARRWYWTRQTRKTGAFVEQVSPMVVLERADGVCGICGEDVDPLDFHVDHIVPLSRCGEHSYANTQPAHPRCNLRKHTKMMEQLG